MATGIKTKYVPSQAERVRVEKLTAFGLTVQQARQLLINPATEKPLSDTTFERVFKRELNIGRDAMTEKIRGNLARIASTGSSSAAVSAIKLWLTLIEGRRNPDTELTGPNGGPIQVEDVTKLTADERAAKIAGILAAAALRARNASADADLDDENSPIGGE